MKHKEGKYFIQNWGDIISTDIDKYILPQLNEEILSKMYSGVILSHLNGWENILQKLNFSINGYVYRPHSGEANLYNLFPYSFLNFGEITYLLLSPLMIFLKTIIGLKIVTILMISLLIYTEMLLNYRSF